MVNSPSSRVARGLVLVLAFLLLLGAFPVLAAVLPPAAGERLGAAFARLVPAWELHEAAVEESEVVASLCAEGTCHEVHFTEPSPDCSGLSLPAWCVHFNAAAPAALRAAVAGEFGGHERADFWLVPEADEGGLGIAQEPPPSALIPVLLALALLLLPIPSGWTIGAALLRLRGDRIGPLWGAGLMLLVPLAPAFLLPLEYLPVGFYELAWLGFFVGVGLVLGGHRWGRALGLREGGVLAGGLFVALALLEVGVRLVLPAPPAFPPPSQAAFRLSVTGAAGVGGQACKGLFPGQFPEVVQERDRFPGRARRVLHVGDSMVEGVGVEPAERFVSRLNEMGDDTAHVNAGFSGTGPDYYYLATRRWLALKGGDAVVWYLYAYNDIDGGLQEPYGCCGGSALLSFGDTDFSVACPEWKFGEQGNRFQRSPAPYAARVATAYLRVAGHLVALHNRLVQPPRQNLVPLNEALRRTGQVLRKTAAVLAEHGAEFTVVLLPYRGVLEGDSEVAARLAPMTEGVLALCRAEGIRCLDGSEAFGPLVESGEVGKGFIDEPVWDYHFSAMGHRLVAEWLFEWLGGDV